ncbi:hypothetical protein ACW189_05115 [Limosilactobacillus fermentum]
MIGVIAFIGIIVPHVGRVLVGRDYRAVWCPLRPWPAPG